MKIPLRSRCEVARGLPCRIRNTANQTFGLYVHWRGKYWWIWHRRKLSGFQSRLAVVRSTTMGVVVFYVPVLKLYIFRAILRKEPP